MESQGFHRSLPKQHTLQTGASREGRLRRRHRSPLHPDLPEHRHECAGSTTGNGGDRQAVPRANRWTDGSSCASQPPPFPERTHDRSCQSHRLKRHEDRRQTSEDHLTTCAYRSAANEPVHLLSEASAKEGASSEALAKEGRRNADITLDAPVSNVMTTTSFGDPQGMPLSVGNRSTSWPRCRKNFVGGQPAPNVSPSSVFGRSCSGLLRPPGLQRRPEGRAASLLCGAGRCRLVCCRRNADETLDAPVSNVVTTCFDRRPERVLLPVGNGGEYRPSGREKLCRQAGPHLAFFPLTFSVAKSRGCGGRRVRDGRLRLAAPDMVRDLHAAPRASTGHFTPPWWIVRLHEATEAS